MNYRIGQRIRIKPFEQIFAMRINKLDTGDYFYTSKKLSGNDSYFVGNMKQYCNKDFTITNIEENKLYCNNGYYWHKDWIVKQKEVINK